MSIASALTARTRPFSSWLMDGVVLAYALWTVTCHAVMLTGGNVRHLVIAVASVAGVGLLGATALAVGRWRRGAPSSVARVAASPAPDPSAPPGPDLRSTIILGVLAILLVGYWLVFAQPAAFWFAVVFYLLTAAVLSSRTEPERVGPPPPARWQEAALWVMALASAFLALYAHRWRNDDCYYVNLAVAMVDRPDAPLLSINTIHAPIAGVVDAHGVFVPYRVHSFEALGGFISHLTGIEAISVIHLGLASASALLIPLSLAHLFRLLDDRRWLWMVVAAMCIHLFEGTSGLGFGNQGIVRMFTGKSVLLSVALPVLARHGIAFGLRPSIWAFVLLLASQITAIGLSSTALWLAPVAAMLAVAVPLKPDFKALRAIGFGLLSCVYVLAMALWVRAHIMPGSSGDDDGGASAALTVAESPFELRIGLVWYWMRKLFDVPRVAQAYLGLLLLAIPLCRTSLARRYLVAFTLALTLLFLNPYIADFIRFNVTGRFTGQRGLWLAPLPAAVAIAFTCFIPNAGGRVKRALGLTAFAATLFAFFFVVPSHGVFVRENNVVLRWPPGPKVPGHAFALARRLSAVLPEGSQVLAPEVVSWYLPTVHRHAFPLLANAKYMSAGRKEENRRKRLVVRVGKHDGNFSAKEQRKLIEELNHYRVNAIVLSRRAAKTRGLSSTLKRAGYRRTKAGVPSYQLWVPRELVARFRSHDAAI